PHPDEGTLVEILRATTGAETRGATQIMNAERLLEIRALVRQVQVADPIYRYVARLVRASDPANSDAAPSARRLLRYGASVRAAQAMLLAGKVFALMSGRFHVSFADLRRVAAPALRHRLAPSFEAEADGVTTDQILEKLLGEVPEVSAAVAAIGE